MIFNYNLKYNLGKEPHVQPAKLTDLLEHGKCNRFDPECEPHLDEVLNQESIHCS